MNQHRFRVVSPFEPPAISRRRSQQLAEGVEDGLRYQTLLGVTGSGKTFTMAKVIEAVQKPTLVMAPNKTLAAQLASELRDFLPDNAVVYFVSYYDYYQPEAYVPSTDTFIEKDASINEEVEKLRHAATAALLSRKDVVVVASASAASTASARPRTTRAWPCSSARARRYDRDELHPRPHRHPVRPQRLRARARHVPRARRRARRLPALRGPSRARRVLRRRDRGDRRGRPAHRRGADHASTSCRSGRRRTTSPSARSSQAALGTIQESCASGSRSSRPTGKLLEAQRLEMRANYDLEMLETMGFSQRHRELLAAPRRARARASRRTRSSTTSATTS